MSATTKKTTKSSGQNGQTLTEMEQAQQELQEAIEAKRQKECESAWSTLTDALPKVAADQPFDSEKVRAALQVVGMSLADLKADATHFASATRSGDDDELAQYGDDHELSARIKTMKQEARENVQKVDAEARRLQGLVGRRAAHRQTVRQLISRGYALDVR